ncbi:CKLF-like MARVEL transmembrane domain-containing protein 8 isoform X1 [Macaca fascicularis]|uniref:CKLF-like MARVEL transmembrane domain-containing protein 8 isoform X1 n=1 Tax=Macaca fascicularis TaxID=9541 RepID=UPI003D15C6C6
MEDPQRARSHTVTTTASSFAENFSTSSSSFAYDREFLRTLPGLLIVAEIVGCACRSYIIVWNPSCGPAFQPLVSSKAHCKGNVAEMSGSTWSIYYIHFIGFYLGHCAGGGRPPVICVASKTS